MRPPAFVSKSHIQICVGSVAFDVQMSRLPSGEKRGRSSWFGVGLSRRDSPPCAGTIHKCEIFTFASRSTSSASNTTHNPSGDGTGAPTRLSFIMSSKVKGCLPLEIAGAGVCPRSDVVSAKLIAMRTLMSRKGSAELAGTQWSCPGSARVSRVGFGVSPKQSFQRSPRWRGRHRQHACATRSLAIARLETLRVPFVSAKFRCAQIAPARAFPAC